MNDMEREDQQFQAEILNKIDVLHGAVMRRRSAWMGCLTMIAIVAMVCLWPVRTESLLEASPMLVAQHAAQPIHDVEDVEIIVPIKPSIHQEHHTALVAEAEVVEPSWEDEDVAHFVAEATEKAAVADKPIVVDESYVEPAAAVPATTPRRTVRHYESHNRRLRVKDLIASSEDPNTDGTNLSIRLI